MAAPTLRIGRFSRKAQSSVEVLIYVSFFILVFVLLNLSFVLQVSQEISQRQFLLAQSSAAQIAQYADLALAAGPGFEARFSIPTAIQGRPYTLHFTDSGSLYVVVAPARGESALQMYFPLSLRNIALSCTDPPATGTLCPGNYRNSYVDASGSARNEWVVDARKGTLRVQNVLDARGYPQLMVE